MSTTNENTSHIEPPDASQPDEEMERLLQDPSKRAQLVQRLGITNPWFSPLLTPSGTSVGDGAASLTPSGMAVGGGLAPPPWFGAPFIVPPFSPWPYPGMVASIPAAPDKGPTAAKSDTSSRSVADSESAKEDVVEPLSDTEAREFDEYYEDFDPSTEPDDSWDPPSAMSSFLERHFNRELPGKDKDAILKEFPKPNCVTLKAPKLDGLVKEQLMRKGKDPRFGTERTLFKLQEQLLEVAGPLTCLWADILNPEVDLKAGEVLHQLQRALVLLGNTSHGITVERRKIACSRINPKLKSIASEEFADRKEHLFGPGFLDKASKIVETEKAFDKVSDSGLSYKRRRVENSEDLRSFLSRGAPARYDSRKIQRLPQSYNQQKPKTNPKNFQYRRNPKAARK